MIMGIIGLSLLSLSCPSPLRQGLVRNVYPTAAPVRNPFSITPWRPCHRKSETPHCLPGKDRDAATDAPERPRLPQVRREQDSRVGHDQAAPMYYCYLDIEISAGAHRGRHAGKATLT
ncbi:hypothetical protein GCM10010521_32150 [Streptomyces rameus]|uniref:Secreted protein n=1 Tax=Streptomyces rameus TaxID=68261 RepID=A0ABP6NE31_9ACTN